MKGNKIEIFPNYDELTILRCPKCKSFNIATADDDKIIDTYYRCKSCGYEAIINYMSPSVQEGIKNLQTFQVDIPYEIVEKVFKKYNMSYSDHISKDILSEMIKEKESNSLGY